MNQLFAIQVKCGSDGFTARHRGLSASSTHSHAMAAEVMANKLFGPSVIAVSYCGQALPTLGKPEHLSPHLYCATYDATWFAYCWSTGLIEFGHRVKPGAIILATGPRRALMEVVQARARHGRAKGQLLVPGIPEADTDADRKSALNTFLRWMHTGDPEPRYGVQFNPPLQEVKLPEAEHA